MKQTVSLDPARPPLNDPPRRPGSHIRLVEGHRAVFLVAEAEWILRRFLKERGIRPEAAAFQAISPPPFMRMSFYRLAGDQALKVQKLNLPRVTWGQLGLLLVGVAQLRRPSYGRMA